MSQKFNQNKNSIKIKYFIFSLSLTYEHFEQVFLGVLLLGRHVFQAHEDPIVVSVAAAVDTLHLLHCIWYFGYYGSSHG